VTALLRHARLPLQLLLLAVAAAIVVDGLLGPQIGPRNLATVLTWIHYRGLLVVALLAAGNLFCGACPMILVRDAGRRITHPALRWPRLLRNKWPAVVLFVAVLFAYERYDLWSLPRATAWLVIAYFAAALLIDVLFSGAAFCKFVCPVGQFNFVASTMSPLELRVVQPATCATCRTVDCIRGRRAPEAPARIVQRGCELSLFMPSKIGNLDCTFCSDCVRACPHDNIALTSRVPGEELIEPGHRSGIGALSRRGDLATLAIVFTFGALLNAFAMTGPGVLLERWFAGVIGLRSESAVLAALFVAALCLLPLALLFGAAAIARCGPVGASPRQLVQRYAYALVPLGFAAWVAHNGFHFLTGALTVVPVAQSAIIDLTGQPGWGEPLWRWTGLRPGAVFPIQLGFLLLGTVGSVGVAWGIAGRDTPHATWRAAGPWLAVIALLAAAAIWTLAQPMDMRGVSFPG
jgi:ferredoxin